MEIIFLLVLIFFGLIAASNALTSRDIRKTEDEIIRIREQTEKIKSGKITLTRSLYGDKEADWEERLPAFIKKCEECALNGDIKVFSIINQRINEFSQLPRIRELKDDDYEIGSIRDAKSKLVESVINQKLDSLYYILNPCFHHAEMHGGGFENQQKLQELLEKAKFEIDETILKDFKKEINDYVDYRKKNIPNYFPALGIDHIIIIYLYPHSYKYMKNRWVYEDLNKNELEKLIERFDKIFGSDKEIIKNNFEKSRISQTKKNLAAYQKAKTKDKFTATQAEKFLDLASIYLFDENKASEEIKDLLDELIDKAVDTKITKAMKEKIDAAKFYKENL